MTAPAEPLPSQNEIATTASVQRLVTATGVATVVTQLLLIREYITQFQGNEFVIALILCLWLMIGAAGSRIAETARRYGLAVSPIVLATLSMAVSGIAPALLVVIRLLRRLWFTPGVSVGFYPMGAFIAVTLLPYAVAVGFLLPYSLMVVRAGNPGYPGAMIYMHDAAGDAIGGAVFAFVLVFFLSPVTAAVVAGIPLAAAAWSVLPPGRRWRSPAVAGLVMAVAGMAAGLGLEERSLALPFAVSVRTVESRYGRLQIVLDSGQTTLYQDGRPVTVSQDIAGAESSVHLALCQRARVARVLVIGTVSGMMTEIAKYGPQTVDAIELDPAATRLLLEDGLITPIAGMTPVHMDARLFLRKTRKRYDAILVNLPDPDTFQINRFYTREFMALAHRHLSVGGVISISLTGYANYIPVPLRQMLASLRHTAATAFRHSALIPGERVTLLASDEALTVDVPRRLDMLGIDTLYLSGVYPWEVTEDRLSQLREATAEPAPVNTDAAPYLMRLAFEQWFLRTGASPVWIYAAIAAVCGGGLLWFRPMESVLFATGFTSMGLEMLVVFAFQIFYGYVYFQIGAIVTAFLTGLIPGAWAGLRRKTRPRRALIFSECGLIALIGGLVLALFTAGDRIPPAGYLFYGCVAAMVCGYQFPLILRALGDDAHSAARAFAADLAGAGAGTLATSLVLLPLTGLYGVAGGLVAVKLVSLARLAFSTGGSTA